MSQEDPINCFPPGHFWPFLSHIASSETNVLSLLLPKDSFCYWLLRLLTFVNGSNKTLKKNWHRHTDTQTNIRTSGLRDWIGPAGRFSENFRTSAWKMRRKKIIAFWKVVSPVEDSSTSNMITTRPKQSIQYAWHTLCTSEIQEQRCGPHCDTLRDHTLCWSEVCQQSCACICYWQVGTTLQTVTSALFRINKSLYGGEQKITLQRNYCFGHKYLG